VDQSLDIGATIISIFGYGEPLIDSGISMKVDYVHRKGLQSFITTNGAFLTRGRAFSLLSSGLDRIRISVHSIHKYEYERIHKGLKYNETMKNIDDFLEINAKHDFGCRVDINCIPPNHDNDEAIQEIVEFWKIKAIDGLEIWEPHNFAYGCNYRMGIISKRTCGRPFDGPIQINADGTMMVCCFDFDARMVIGDTYTHTIADILKFGPINDIKEKHHKGDLSGLPCEFCDQLYSDTGTGSNPLIYSSIDSDINRSFATKHSLGDK